MGEAKEHPDNVHVVPVDDLKEHEASPSCWCRPTRDPCDPHLFIHNSLDRRERYEGLRPQ